MKTYTTIEEVKKDIVNGVLRVDDDIHITFDDCEIEADIVCFDLTAHNLIAHDIMAQNITARNINALNITALNINALDINADNINADNINAHNINAYNIDYYGVCFAYKNIFCTSIRGRRENAKHFCLDGEITIRDREPETIEILGKFYLREDVEEKLRELTGIASND